MSKHQPLALPCHEDLAQLARDDPNAYEVLRRKLIASFIQSAPKRLKRRLLGVQFRVDQIRRLSGTALGSTVKVYELMWKSFQVLSSNLNQLTVMRDNALSGRGTHYGLPGGSAKTAQILQFRRRS